MTLKETAEIYFKAGLSVIPVHQNKVPIGKWEDNTKTLLPPKESFSKAEGIGLVCGKVSGGIEVIDVDQKYSIDGKLMEEYLAIVENTGSDIDKKVVIQKTQNGGFHVIYRCKEIGGNTKFANRYATSDELAEQPNRKIQGLLESRGEGGYIMCAPSKGYEIIQGNLLNIPEITAEERDILISCAKSFNEVPDTIPMPANNNFSGTNPFTQFNEEADVPGLLQKHGWIFVKEVKGSQMYKRPGSNSLWSGGYDPNRRLFYVFTSSTVFEPNKAYNPSQVMCYLEFNKDYKEMAAYLKQLQYGELHRNITQDKPKNSFITTAIMEMGYLKMIRTGNMEMGKTTGFEGLDAFWRIKEATVNIFNGIDNTGKSQVSWFFAVLAAINHGWKFLIYAGENKAGNVFRKLMEFYLCKTIKEMTDEEFKRAREFIDRHFRVISNKEVFTFRNILDIADEAIAQERYHKLIIDPWNSLTRDKKISGNSHEHDEEALRIIKHWAEKRKCAVDIVCHAVTDSYRNRYPKDHPKYANMAMPPQKGDTEGGSKFATKADDFITVHRHTQHSDDWRWTEIHVRKIKETETGGRQTFLDNPFRMKMLTNQCGFEDENGYNPVTKITSGVKEIKNTNHEPERIESEELPF